jgi:hypothetical protein
MTMMKVTKCKCRYCGERFNYTSLRGRHEKMKHGAVFNGAAAALSRLAVPAVEIAPAPISQDTPIGHIQSALDQLNKRCSEIAGELERLEQLKAEYQALVNQSRILTDALSSISAPFQGSSTIA